MALTLPASGFAVQHRNAVTLYTSNGRRIRVLRHVQIAGAAFNRHPWLQDRHGRYLRLRGGRTVFRAVRLPPRPIEREGASRCVITDLSRHASVTVCSGSSEDQEFHTRLTVRECAHTLRVRRYPPGLPGGYWQYGALSPSGQQLLAQWSGECEVPQAYLVDTSTGDITPVGNSISADAPESEALGWSSAGLPVVEFPMGACGPGEKTAGVYLTSPTGRVGRLLIATREEVVMWF